MPVCAGKLGCMLRVDGDTPFFLLRLPPFLAPTPSLAEVVVETPW